MIEHIHAVNKEGNQVTIIKYRRGKKPNKDDPSGRGWDEYITDDKHRCILMEDGNFQLKSTGEILKPIS